MGQRGERADGEVWPWVQTPVLEAGGASGSTWVGVAPDGLLSWLQDSDGDKSDDLVVDVSNEVSTDRPGLWHAPLGVVLGGLSRLLLQRGWQPEQGSEASGVGALGCSGGGGQGLACMVAQVPRTGAQGRKRKHASGPRKGPAPFPHGPPGQLCFSLPSPDPGILRVGVMSPMGPASAAKEDLERAAQGQEAPLPRFAS